MTATRGGPPTLTDGQLADVLRFVARLCLEVERGLRPPAHLSPFLDPSRPPLQPDQLGSFGGGPVAPDHIGQPQISRLTATHVVATVTTRTEANRWGALSLELHAHAGRWRIAGLQRLLAATHYLTPLSTQIGADERWAAWQADVAEARRMAKTAHDENERRLAALVPGSVEHRATRDVVSHWRRTLRDLDRQLADGNVRPQTPDDGTRQLRR
jgi:hypothetical protein